MELYWKDPGQPKTLDGELVYVGLALNVVANSLVIWWGPWYIGAISARCN